MVALGPNPQGKKNKTERSSSEEAIKWVELSVSGVSDAFNGLFCIKLRAKSAIKSVLDV